MTKKTSHPFALTIVLGIIFVSSVYNNLTMPEFSATLLGLMGLKLWNLYRLQVSRAETVTAKA